MEVTSINYFGNDSWEYCTDFNYTRSAELHIPSVGDTIKNKAGKLYIVKEVIWNLQLNSIVINCELISI